MLGEGGANISVEKVASKVSKQIDTMDKYHDHFNDNSICELGMTARVFDSEEDNLRHIERHVKAFKEEDIYKINFTQK